MKIGDRIYIAGHTGLVGSALVRRLKEKGYNNLILRTRAELDLLDESGVRAFFEQERPDVVINCAAKVGGVQAKLAQPVEFLLQNLKIQNNIIDSARSAQVKKLLFVGSSVIYPADSPQPIKEEYAMSGQLDPVNEAYAYAKIIGMKLCEYISQEDGLHYISCTPTNVFGVGDHFDPAVSHVIPSLMRRMHEAKISKDPSLNVRGGSTTKREFIYVDDLADAIVWLMSDYSGKEALNIGTGSDISIGDLADKIKSIVGYEGTLQFDTDEPGGVPQRLLDTTKLHEAGWHHTVDLDDGLARTYQWYLDNVVSSDSAKQ